MSLACQRRTDCQCPFGVSVRGVLIVSVFGVSVRGILIVSVFGVSVRAVLVVSSACL